MIVVLVEKEIIELLEIILMDMKIVIETILQVQII